MMKNIPALRGLGLSLVGFILIGSSFSSAASPGETVFPEFAGPVESTEVEPAALQAGAEEGWRAQMQQDLARREYHATPADPEPLRQALLAALPGGDELAAGLDDKLLQSPNRAHDLRTYYLDDRIAVLPRTADQLDWVLTLRTEGIGRGAEPADPLPSASPVSDGNQVRYTHGPVEEWYVNSADGVEQGWTLEQRPPGDGELRLDVAVGGLVADVGDDGIRFRGFGPGAATALHYDKLLAFDANGKTLRARLEATPAGFGIVVDDGGASYPITIDPLLTTPTWQGEGNQLDELFGSSVAGAGDVNGDGFADVIVGAPRFDNGQTGEGAAFVYFGSASGTAVTPAWQAESDQVNARLGNSVAGAGDVNGDGFDDVIVGAALFDFRDLENCIGNGGAFVYLGSASGLALAPAWQAEGDACSARFGTSVAGAGDINGDGFDDVIVGAPNFKSFSAGGAAFVFLGSASGVSDTHVWQREAEQRDAFFGASVASAGDVDGDGYDDVIVGAPRMNYSRNNEGRAFVYFGSASGVPTRGWAEQVNQEEARFGFSVAGAGDVNGDGFDDVIVGAPYFDAGQTDEGAAFVFHGSAVGLADSAAWRAESDQASAGFGESVSGAGDVNGDGFADVIVGAGPFGNNAGAAFVYLGNASGLVDTPAWQAEIDQAGARFGRSVADAGDVNGDGFADVIVGAPLFGNSEAFANEGAAFLYLGGIFTIGGTVSGLAGTGLVLQNNGGDDLAINANGAFTFATGLPDGSTYDITVAIQPSELDQTCTVVNGTGTLARADVTDVQVDCVSDSFTVGGAITGLEGDQVVLQNNGGDYQILTTDGSFTFTAQENGTSYDITVAAQPSSPSQTCTVINGAGTLASADVTDVQVDCAIETFTVGGSVSGLAGTGLVLQNNGGDDLAISADGAFSFPAELDDLSPYNVTVAAQPSELDQTCTVVNGTGTLAGADVTDVQVDCVTDSFTVGGAITGLEGDQVVLQNNGGDDQVLTADGGFTFTAQDDGTSYDITVAAQPSSPSQTCTVTNGSGTLAGSDVKSVQIDCVTRFTVGGNVSGLEGSGLVLQNNGGDDLAIDVDGPFTFATSLDDGSSYAVSVATQPSGPSQTCTVTNGSGTLAGFDVTNLQVDCVTDTFTVGGAVSGLEGTGLMLQNNGGDALSISADGAFTFPAALKDGESYSVIVYSRPTDPKQVCSVTNGEGNLSGGPVNDIAVDCLRGYSVSGSVFGLRSPGLVIELNNKSALLLEQDADFTFPLWLTTAENWDIQVIIEPDAHTCTAWPESGVIGGYAPSDIEGVAVECSTDILLNDSFENLAAKPIVID